MIGRKDVGNKDDKGKDPWHLVPWGAMREVVRALAYGAHKYGEWNWRKITNPEDRYYGAALRHMVAYRTGETIDPESGEWKLPHLACAICSLLFLLAGFDEKQK